jgi:hypothetical protein
MYVEHYLNCIRVSLDGEPNGETCLVLQKPRFRVVHVLAGLRELGINTAGNCVCAYVASYHLAVLDTGQHSAMLDIGQHGEYVCLG